MARKKTRRRRATKKSQSPAWLWLLTGILIGLGTATWAVLQGYIPQPKSNSKTDLPVAGNIRPKDNEKILTKAEKEKARHKKPQYDFYTVLEEVETPVPEKVLKQKVIIEASQPQANAKQASTQKATGNYVIQVGSFQNPKDADAMKARLAFLGAQAHIQKVTINEKTWQRVRLGPYASASEVEAMRSNLKNNGIDSRIFQAK